jgi:gluconolactonase
MAAAVKFDAEGRMVTTEGADFGGRRITRTDMKTGLAKIVAATYKGHPFNSPNDLDIDSKGRIYFTDPRYFGSEPIEQPVAGVYRIDTDGSVHLILADMRSPNGIAISTDEKTLYVSEVDLGVNEVSMLSEKVPQQFGKMQIKAYDLQPDGTAINGRVFVDYGSEKGADGLTVDQDGNLYAGVQAESRLGIRIYSPAGEEIGSIPFTESPRNMVLVPQGEGAVLYVTAGKSLYQIPTSIPPRKWAQQN